LSEVDEKSLNQCDSQAGSHGARTAWSASDSQQPLSDREQDHKFKTVFTIPWNGEWPEICFDVPLQRDET
jgi:hypothetical protein